MHRKWLVEFLEFDAAQADQFIVNVAKSQTLQQYFRSDTLIAAISAPNAVEFLEQLKPALLENGAHLLKRIIHLLRVACKATAPMAQRLRCGEINLVNPGWHGTRLASTPYRERIVRQIQ